MTKPQKIAAACWVGIIAAGLLWSAYIWASPPASLPPYDAAPPLPEVTYGPIGEAVEVE